MYLTRPFGNCCAGLSLPRAHVTTTLSVGKDVEACLRSRHGAAGREQAGDSAWEEARDLIEVNPWGRGRFWPAAPPQDDRTRGVGSDSCACRPQPNSGNGAKSSPRTMSLRQRRRSRPRRPRAGRALEDNWLIEDVAASEVADRHD